MLAVGAFARVSPPFVCASRSTSGKPSAVDEVPDPLAAAPVEVALPAAAPVSVELLAEAPVSVEVLEEAPVAVELLAPSFLPLPFFLPVVSLFDLPLPALELVSVELVPVVPPTEPVSVVLPDAPVATPVSVELLVPSSTDETLEADEPAADEELFEVTLS